MDLYLVRHAIAEERDPERWPNDAERPLTREGEQRFRAVARGLRRIVPRVDLVLSSPYTRAWQTAKMLEALAGWPAAQECPALMAGQSPATMLEALEPYAASGSVALVGHEPDLSALAAHLIGAAADEARIQMKKGGVAALRFEGDVQTARATLRWLLPPSIMRSLK